ncbi:MAG: GGDEF domain-containing protein [Devosia sp.]
MPARIDLSPTSKGRVIVTTIAGTLVCVCAALVVDFFNLADMDEAARLRGLSIDIILPVILAVPLLLFFTSKLRELAIAHQKLTIYASTDALTNVLNRGAFSTLVDAYLRDVRLNSKPARGAMLIVDADNFKSINDSYGHDRGDEALRMIAASIKSMLRAPDLVGRLGGEEFGVFLPGPAPDQAEAVAERIRLKVFEAKFQPNGRVHRLSVSVGGAAFDRPIEFQDLFRLADQQLYAAKQSGRNRVSVGPARPFGSLAAA